VSFNVGDRVRLISPDGDSGSSAKVGDLGTVHYIAGDFMAVNIDGLGITHRFTHRFERVTPADEVGVGDTIRLTVEGKVDRLEDGDVQMDGVWRCLSSYTVEVTEKAKPPVVTFKPGEFVRHKTHGSTYLVTTSGVTALSDGSHYARDAEWREKYLTSKHYDKVELHEAPL
jgi:hypothetical protein